jgi:hypothetical protein
LVASIVAIVVSAFSLLPVAMPSMKSRCLRPRSMSRMSASSVLHTDSALSDACSRPQIRANLDFLLKAHLSADVTVYSDRQARNLLRPT